MMPNPRHHLRSREVGLYSSPTKGEPKMSPKAAQTADTEVLIIGAGPAGLFAASELLRHGVRPRIVEQRRAPHHETRGTGIQPAVLELLDRGGLVDRFLEAGVHIYQIETVAP